MSFAKYYSDGRKENLPASVNDAGKVLTAGFDETEGVNKVAMLAWNTSTLSWERMSSSAVGGSQPTAGAKTRRIDQASATTLYIGEAEPGSSTASPLWRIRRVTLTASGEPVAIEYAHSGSSIGIWDSRNSLSYS